MGQLNNKKVIITGGCKGIGRAIVEKFLSEGAYVAATYYQSIPASQQLATDFIEYQDRLRIYQLNVSDENQVSVVMEQIQQDLDGVDVLINNAGIAEDNLVYSMKADSWDRVIKTNLYGPFYVCKSVLLNMISQKSGCIINIASVSGIRGKAGQSNYCASKFGLIGLTKSLAKETAIKNVRVNAIAPGYIKTEMLDQANDMSEILQNKHSLGRIGNMNEIANVAHFLASDAASYITGQVIVADGGLT